jgi:hypothetical protein
MAASNNFDFSSERSLQRLAVFFSKTPYTRLNTPPSVSKVRESGLTHAILRHNFYYKLAFTFTLNIPYRQIHAETV